MFPFPHLYAQTFSSKPKEQWHQDESYYLEDPVCRDISIWSLASTEIKHLWNQELFKNPSVVFNVSKKKKYSENKKSNLSNGQHNNIDSSE